MTEYEERTDRFTAVEDRFAGYTVYDPAGEKIGKVDDLFLDETESPEYIGVKMGFLGTRSTLIPWDVVSSTDDEGRTITVAIDKDAAKNGPTFDDDMEINSDFEREVHSYYGLEYATEERGSYGDYNGETAEAQIGDDEVVVPVTEEEVVVGKRPVVKEEVRIRKDVVEDTEVVEEDVRREEIEVEDETNTRRSR